MPLLTHINIFMDLPFNTMIYFENNFPRRLSPFYTALLYLMLSILLFLPLFVLFRNNFTPKISLKLKQQAKCDFSAAVDEQSRAKNGKNVSTVCYHCGVSKRMTYGKIHNTFFFPLLPALIKSDDVTQMLSFHLIKIRRQRCFFFVSLFCCVISIFSHLLCWNWFQQIECN